MGPFEVDSSTSQNGRKVTDAAIASQIIKQLGNVSAIARELKMRRCVIRERINISPDLTQTLDDNREGVIDDAETNMFKAAKVGDIPACRFVLSTIGKNRGYGTRTEHTGLDGAPMAAEVTYHMVKASG